MDQKSSVASEPLVLHIAEDVSGIPEWVLTLEAEGKTATPSTSQLPRASIPQGQDSLGVSAQVCSAEQQSSRWNSVF